MHMCEGLVPFMCVEIEYAVAGGYCREMHLWRVERETLDDSGRAFPLGCSSSS